jgi:hypothetical protein
VRPAGTSDTCTRKKAIQPTQSAACEATSAVIGCRACTGITSAGAKPAMTRITASTPIPR